MKLFFQEIPNLNQSLFKGVRILEFKKPKIKKNSETTIDQKYESLLIFN